MLKGKTVLLGVTGSIAAYKAAYLASALKKQHADVHVLMTRNAEYFINPITFETLTGNKCLVIPLIGILSFRWSMCLCQESGPFSGGPGQRGCNRQAGQWDSG